ncbi:MAG: TolC family protein [Prolixibacteraceae bacterium]
MNVIKTILVWILCYFSVHTISAQQTYNLNGCVKYALENNHNLKKSQLDQEKSMEARREIMGSLLPQINGSGNMNYNLKKANFIMPNFINEMLPANAQDPTAPKYMTIEMGTNYSAALAASLNQQIINFSLFNALEISKTAEKLADLGIESIEEDIIAQTANLYYAIQSTIYAAQQFDESIGLIDKMLQSLEVSYENGLIKKVDVDRVKITKVNMMTQQSAISNAVEVQKNLMKLQMGLDMDYELSIEEIDLSFFENKAEQTLAYSFERNQILPYRLLQEQHNIGQLQLKSVQYESLPTLSLGLNYQHNFVSDEFFRGETYYNYPASMVGLNVRVPLFAGLSRSAKLKGTKLELQKIEEDKSILDQSLTMAYKNAMLKLKDSKATIDAQRENRTMAEEVYKISESNYLQGLASMSDVLNSNSSLVQSQISYADALNKYMQAYIELRKANGTIRVLIDNKQF